MYTFITCFMIQPAGRCTYCQSKARYSWNIFQKISPYKPKRNPVCDQFQTASRTKLPCRVCLFSSPPVLVDVECEWSPPCASGHGRGHHRARCGGLLAPFPNITVCLGLGGRGGALVDAVGEALHGAGILKSIREHVHMMSALRGRGREPYHLTDAGIVPSASELGVL